MLGVNDAMNVANNNYPYSEYERALDKVLEQAVKDYWTQYIDINRHQADVARTYLWVSAAMLGSYSTIAHFIGLDFTNLFYWFIIPGIFAVLFAIIAFGVCLFALPSRKGYMRIGESWGTYSQMAYDGLCRKEQSLYRNTVTALIDDFDAAAVHNLNTNLRRAKLLRLTSWLLLISFCFGLIGIATIGYQKIANYEGIEMTDDNSTPTTGQGQTTATPEPDARPPKGPITTTPHKIITHDAKPVNTRIIITEDKD